MRRLLALPIILLILATGTACSPHETPQDSSTAGVNAPAVEGQENPSLTWGSETSFNWGDDESFSSIGVLDTPVSLSPDDPEQAPVDTLEQPQEATGEASGRLQIGSVLNVPLNQMSPSASIVNPPNGTDAFVITGEGYGTTGNDRGETTFIVMHSGSHRSGAVGNNLIDRDRGVSTVVVGDQVVLDGLDYKVSRVEVEVKDELRDEAWVWENKQGRIVILTCLQRPVGEGRSVQNVVIEATRS